jgi:hypothetical protein
MLCLSFCSDFIIEPQFYCSFRRLAFTILTNSLFKSHLSPSSIKKEFESMSSLSHEAFQARIQMFGLVSKFFKFPEALQVEFMQYTDSIFSLYFKYGIKETE